MQRSTWDSLIRWILEWWGRRRAIRPVEFPEDQIILNQPQGISVWWFLGAVYLPLPPDVFAILVTPEGNRFNISGGYNVMRSGRYGLQYIDKHDRAEYLPPVSETTLDGAKVSFSVYIRYRVGDPLKVLEIDNPLQTYFNIIASDIKEYIRSHNHDEILNVNDNIDNKHLSRFITQRQTRHLNIARAFILTDIGIEERQGDPKLTEIRKTIRVNQNQNVAEVELLRQKSALEQENAQLKANIDEIRAEGEVQKNKILEAMNWQQIALNEARKSYQFRQDRTLKALDAISQAITAPGYPINPNEVRAIMQDLVVALREEEQVRQTIPDTPPQEKPTVSDGTLQDKADKAASLVDSLTNTLLNLLDRKTPDTNDRL